MTLPEEIEQLKLQISKTHDEHAEAELIIQLLTKYSASRNRGFLPYNERLLTLADKLESPRYKAWGLFRMADLKSITQQFEEALTFAQQALVLFQQTGEKQSVELADVYFRTGEIYTGLANYAEGMSYYLQSLKMLEEIGNKRSRAMVLEQIGQLNMSYLGNYPEALKCYLEALQFFEENGLQKNRGSAAIGVGRIQNIQGNYAESKKNFLNGIQIFEELDDKGWQAAGYAGLAEIEESLGNFSEALEYCLKINQLFAAIEDKNQLAINFIDIGALYEKLGNYKEALKNLQQALQIAETTGHNRAIGYSYNVMGDVYAAQGNFAEAVKSQLTAYAKSLEMGERILIKRTALALYKGYKSLHDPENALKYHEEYHQIENKLLGEESTKQLNNLSFMHNLEQKEKDLEIEQLRNVELKKERDRSENLLLNILPGEVAEELKQKGTADAKLFDDVTVLFTDFKGFTKVSERLTPQQLVDELHTCFSAFDGIMHKYNIEKIKTVGDAYLAVSGLPLPNSNHAEDVVKAAIEIRDFMLNRKHQTSNIKLETFEVRIGVHSGSVVAGIVGIKKFAYDIWGDTVNTAARMEQNGEAGKINISQTTYQLVKDKFTCEYRGEIEAKNKGKLKMYFIQ